MDTEVLAALALTPQSSAWDRTIEITTRGARSGLAHRIEIWLYRVDETNYLTGMPGRVPDWYRNIEATPEFIVHLTHGVGATLPAIGTPITDDRERRRVFTSVVADLNQPRNPGGLRQPTALSEWMNASVLVGITFA